MPFSDYDAAINAIVENIDFDESNNIEKARMIMEACSFLLSGRPINMSQTGAALGFDNNFLENLYKSAADFIKYRKRKKYKNSFIRRGFS